MSKKLRVLVIDADDKPIAPLLVPVTIQWVEADRAYKTTFLLTFSSVLVAGVLLALGTATNLVLGVTLGALIFQAAVRAYVRFASRRDLDAMRRRLGIKD